MKSLVLLLIAVLAHCFSNEPGPCLQVPLRFSPLTCVPLVEVEIEEKKYSLQLDLGSSHPIDLKKRAIQRIRQKELLGTFKYFDMRGGFYWIPAFKIPLVKIGKIGRITNISIHEESIDFLTKGCKGYPVKERFWDKIVNWIADELNLFWIDGRLGWTALSTCSWYIDFPHAKLVAAKDVADFVECAGCSIKGFVQVPFTLEGYGIVLVAQTDLGEKKLLLDTGATRSAYRDSVDRRLKMRLEFGGCDFGLWEFCSFPLDDQFKIDGVLGADFFRSHAICVDFAHQVVYIQP